MSKQKKYYKIVSASFHSHLTLLYYSSTIINRAQVSYHENLWTYAHINHSKLFIFDSLENARKLTQYRSNYAYIYEVEVKNPSHIKLMCPCTSTSEEFAQFWKNRKNKKQVYTNIPVAYRASPPKGTMVCDALKLIKRVD